MKIEFVDDDPFSHAVDRDSSAQQLLQRSAGTVQKLKEIESPCLCEHVMCEHWMELATFVIAKEEYLARREHFDEDRR